MQRKLTFAGNENYTTNFFADGKQRGGVNDKKIENKSKNLEAEHIACRLRDFSIRARRLRQIVNLQTDRIGAGNFHRVNHARDAAVIGRARRFDENGFFDFFVF